MPATLLTAFAGLATSCSALWQALSELMSNMQWRKFRVESSMLIEKMHKEQLPSNFLSELERISALIEDNDYLNSTPKVFSQAPALDSGNVSKSVKDMYQQLMVNAERFNR